MKHAVVRYVRSLGRCVIAPEVQGPIPRYRVDVAVWFDRPTAAMYDMVAQPPPCACNHSHSTRVQRHPLTFIIECKQSRGDFLRDSAEVAFLRERQAHLQRVREQMESERIAALEPELRNGDGLLFPELGSFEFERSRLPAYRALLRELARVQQQLYGQTKFFWFARYRLADCLYLCAPRGMIAPNEVPPCWGLLECSMNGLRAIASRSVQRARAGEEQVHDAAAIPDVRVTKQARFLDADVRCRVRLLRNIASRTAWVEPATHVSDNSHFQPLSTAVTAGANAVCP